MSSNGNTSMRHLVGGLCLALCASLGAVAVGLVAAALFEPLKALPRVRRALGGA